MQRRELYRHLASVAEPIYGRGEAEQIARMILEEMAGVGLTQLVAEPEAECEIDLERVEREISKARPVQYIIGEAEFRGLRIGVREGALIPRAESEELIEWIVSEGSEAKMILDLGTGSGALAIALSHEIKGAEVTAMDISDDALAIAVESAERLHAEVKFIKGDILKGAERYVEGEFDVIVSNPPYIPASEIDIMRPNVTEHEPHLALFVPDDDPLIFYRAIAHSACKLLSDKGQLYFEIHESFGGEICEMLREIGYQSVELRNDINDKARMIRATRP